MVLDKKCLQRTSETSMIWLDLINQQFINRDHLLAQNVIIITLILQLFHFFNVKNLFQLLMSAVGSLLLCKVFMITLTLIYGSQIKNHRLDKLQYLFQFLILQKFNYADINNEIAKQGVLESVPLHPRNHVVYLFSSVQLFCDTMDCSPPGSSVHGIFQARILEWVAISFSRGSSPSRDQTWVSWIGRWVLYH